MWICECSVWRLLQPRCVVRGEVARCSDEEMSGRYEAVLDWDQQTHYLGFQLFRLHHNHPSSEPRFHSYTGPGLISPPLQLGAVRDTRAECVLEHSRIR